MKVKFYIKPIPNFLTKLTNKLSTSSRNEDNENIVKKDINIFEKQSKEIYTNSNTNTLFEFNIETLNNFENLTIASLKYSFSQSKNINPDSIIFYKLNQENLYEEIEDSIKLCNIVNKGINYIYELYYKKILDIIKIIINFYQMNIDKIFIKLSSICSIEMLKIIINEKLNNTLEINSLKIYGLYIIDINSKEKKIMNQSKEINNNITLKKIINFYYENPNSQYMIYFLLSRNKNNKLQMGLNFKFNYLKNISKINFNNQAPSYCECSDGINLFAYCRKENCILNNNLFIKVLGYGIFNIMKEIEKVNCPFCNNKSEVKNIGLINSKWFYKGNINSNKQNSFEGDGITIDNQLYILKEAKINSILLKLIIDVKPYFVKRNNSNINLNRDLDDIGFYDESYKENHFEEKKFSFYKNFNDNIKYYETENEIKSMDIEIDKEDKIICHECKINSDNLCFIF